MKGVLGAWLALAIFSSPAAARLGETRQECIERYGEPVSVDKEQSAATFHKAGFLVKLYFHEDKCEWLILSKFAEGTVDAFQEISEFEIESMLAANSKGLDWEVVENSSTTGLVWRTVNDSLRANYDPGPHWTLSIYTTEAFRRRSFKPGGK